MRKVVCALVCLSAIAGAQDAAGLTFAKKRYQVRALEFEVAVPEGWKGTRDRTGFVARDAQLNGFQITREPFLGDEDTYAETWATTLAAAGKVVEVKRERAGRYKAWRAQWKVGRRTVDIWRVYVPANEMLYNVAFSTVDNFAAEELRDGVLKSLVVKSSPKKMVFHVDAETLTNTVFINLPTTYVKAPRRRSTFLGGGIASSFVHPLPGYTPRHNAGVITIEAVNPRGPNSDPKEALKNHWDKAYGGGTVLKKARGKNAKFGPLKGYSMEGSVLVNGVAKRWFSFLGKHRYDAVRLTILVDERELRLDKSYIKSITKQIKTRE